MSENAAAHSRLNFPCNDSLLSARQGSASLLLASLEKERELLRVFLKVSQMENSLLRRMNLSSFLMVSPCAVKELCV